MEAMAAQQGRTDPAEEGVAESATTTGQGDVSADAQAATATDPQKDAEPAEPGGFLPSAKAAESRASEASRARAPAERRQDREDQDQELAEEESDVSAVALEPLCAVGVAQGIEAQAQAARAVLERKKETTETGCQVEVEVSMQAQASQTQMELKDSMTQTTAEPEPSLAEGLSEGRELAMLASSTATPPSELPLSHGLGVSPTEAAVTTEDTETAPGASKGTRHSEAGPPAPSSEAGELREATPPDTAAFVPVDFRTTMESAHERLRRFSQNSSGSEAAQAQAAEDRGREGLGEEGDAENGSDGSDTNEDDEVPWQQSTATAEAGRRLSAPKVPSSLERSLRVPSKSRRRRRRRIRASLRLLKAMEESGRPAGQALTMSNISDILRSRSERVPNRSGSDSEADASEASSEPEVAEKSAQSSLNLRRWKELPVEILEWLKVSLMQSEEARVHGGVYEVTPLESWPEIADEARLRLVLDFEEFLGPKGLCRAKLSKYELSQRLRERLHHSEPPDGRRRRGAEAAGAPLYEFPLNAEPVQISARLRQAMALQWSQAQERDREGRQGQARDAHISWREDGSWKRAQRAPHRDTEPSGFSFREGRRDSRRGWLGQASRSPSPRLHVGARGFSPNRRFSRSPLSPSSREGELPSSKPSSELFAALARALEGSRRRQKRWAWQQLGGRSSRRETSSPSESPEGRAGFRKDGRERERLKPLDFHGLGPTTGRPSVGLERLESTWQGFSDRSWLRPPARPHGPDLHGATQHGLVPAPPRPMAKLPRRPDFQKRLGPPEKFDRESWQAPRHSGLENYIGCVAWNYRDIQVPMLKSDFAAQMRDDQARNRDADARDARVAAWQRHFRLSDLSEKKQKTTRTTAATPAAGGVGLPSLQPSPRPERPRLDRSLERHAVPSEELQEKGWTAR